MRDSDRYRAVPHPERGGDGWIVQRRDGCWLAFGEPMPHPDAVILAERLNMHWERLGHWESEVLNPKAGRS